MLVRFKITVRDTVIDKSTGATYPCHSSYFVEYTNEQRFNNHFVHLSLHDSRGALFISKEEAEATIKTLPSTIDKADSKYSNNYEYGVEAVEYTHANHCGYSDVHPYEIVRVVSSKTIEIRLMDAELVKGWKPEIVAGGFSGHCVNQGSQQYSYKSNPDNGVIRARLRKDGRFYSNHGRHSLTQTPYKFYDYNF